MVKSICIDFDGSVVRHRYPDVGEELPHCVRVLQRLQDAGINLILFTMRSGPELADAERWFLERGIRLYGVNRNPTQDAWTTSPKAYAQLYIDDAALGCPLQFFGKGERPAVDWSIVEEYLEIEGVLPTPK